MGKGGARDYYLPKSHFKALAGMTDPDIDLIVSLDTECQGNEDGHPVFAIMKYLYSQWRVFMGRAKRGEVDLDDKEIKRKIHEQKYLSLVLINEQKAALLISKAMAEQRSTKTLSYISNMIEKTIIPNAAEELATEDVEGKVRKISEILVKHFRLAVDELYRCANNLSWSDDGESNLLKSRLAKLKEEDPEFEIHYQNLYNEAEVEDEDE